MYKVNYDESDGRILGIYKDGIHSTIPTPVIEIADAAWQNLIDNNHNKINLDGSTEVFEFRSAAEVLAEREKCLYDSCYGYQLSKVDSNTKDEIDKAQRYVEDGTSSDGPTDFPLADAAGAELKAVWGEDTDAASPDGSYFARKAYAAGGNEPSYDFTNLTLNVPSFTAIVAERKAFTDAL